MVEEMGELERVLGGAWRHDLPPLYLGDVLLFLFQSYL